MNTLRMNMIDFNVNYKHSFKLETIEIIRHKFVEPIFRSFVQTFTKNDKLIN